MRSRPDSPTPPWAWVALGLVILFVVAERIRLLNLPLERDEGEYAYIGQLMLQGIAPYKLAYAIKLPGTAAVYAVSMALFGQTAVGIHLGLLLANVAAIVLLFLLGKRWLGGGAGLVAAGVYAILSLGWCCSGSAAHATQFIMPAALGGILLLQRGLQSGRRATLFCSGLLLGWAFVLKQPGIVFTGFGAVSLAAHEWKAQPRQWRAILEKAAAYSLGAILPFAVLCLIVWRAGVFDRFWYWSFTVARGAWTPWPTALSNLAGCVRWWKISGELPFWVAAGLALAAAWWMRLVQPVRFDFIAFCAASILGTSLSLRFNTHYFVLSLGAVGLLIGAGLMEIRRLMIEAKLPIHVSPFLVFLFCGMCGYALWSDSAYFFTDSSEQVGRDLAFGNPFIEAEAVAEFIKKNSAPDSRVAVLGSEPEIYFLSHRHSATGHVSVYLLTAGLPWSHALQEEMAREITNAAPEYIVLVRCNFSWLMPDGGDYTILKTMAPYINRHYELTGLVLCSENLGEPTYYWGADALAPRPELTPNRNCLFVYKRKTPQSSPSPPAPAEK